MTWTKQITSTTTTPTSKWANKKVNWLGDSITRGWGTTKQYHVYLNERIGFTASRNYGIDGSTIANLNDPMYSRATTIDIDADLVCVFGGTNDWGNNIPLGVSYTLDASNNRVASTDTSTFYGALHTLCKNLISRYSTKQLALLTPIHRGVYGTQPTELKPNTNGDYLNEYVQAVLEIGSWYSIPVCNLWDNSMLQPIETPLRDLYFSSTDGVHPNLEGHRVLADKIETFINSL